MYPKHDEDLAEQSVQKPMSINSKEFKSCFQEAIVP